MPQNTLSAKKEDKPVAAKQRSKITSFLDKEKSPVKSKVKFASPSKKPTNQKKYSASIL